MNQEGRFEALYINDYSGKDKYAEQLATSLRNNASSPQVLHVAWLGY